jgi:adenylylsulfate kinase-like enzyme
MPLELLKHRDPKGIYKKFYKNQATNIVGLDINADFPFNPNITIKEFPLFTISKVASDIIANFRKWIKHDTPK